MAKKKEKSTMQKITTIVVWGMLIALLVGLGIQTVSALRYYFG